MKRFDKLVKEAKEMIAENFFEDEWKIHGFDGWILEKLNLTSIDLRKKGDKEMLILYGKAKFREDEGIFLIFWAFEDEDIYNQYFYYDIFEGKKEKKKNMNFDEDELKGWRLIERKRIRFNLGGL